MQYIEAPSREKAKHVSVFLGGGISGCPDWQSYVVDKLKDKEVTLYNPRRKNFPMDDPTASAGQIKWEYERLRKADVNTFWFCKETLCPIVLFELGSALEREKKIILGMDPDYGRRQDVEIQVGLRRPWTEICYSLDYFIDNIKKTI
jgi:hypothetical protein